MAADFTWSGTYGTSDAPTTVDLGENDNLFNYKNLNSLADPNDYQSYPITKGNNSYEVWIRGHFTGIFNKIWNVKVYKTSGTLGTGESIKFAGTTEVYVTPVATASTIAITDISEVLPSSANVSIGGDLAGELIAAGYTDYIVTQLQTTVSAETDDTELFNLMIYYYEN